MTDNQPRYTTERMKLEIAKAKEYARREALEEAAVVARLKESGFLEVEIRVECLARCDDGYQDEIINAGWHYWNEALWKNAQLVDPGFFNGPDGLDFATPNEVFDKGPEAVREWQEARGRKPRTPPAETNVAGFDVDKIAKAIVLAACELDDMPDPADDDTLLITVQDLEAVAHRHITVALERAATATPEEVKP